MKKENEKLQLNKERIAKLATPQLSKLIGGQRRQGETKETECSTFLTTTNCHY